MSSFRNFGIAFVIALILFSLAAYVSLNYAANLFAASDDGGGSASADSQKFDGQIVPVAEEPIRTGRSFNAVIIGTDYDPDTYSDYKAPSVNDGKLYVTRKIEAGAVLFVRFDKEKRALYLASVPVCTEVTVDYVTMTLGQAYACKGGEFVRDKVASYFGKTIDYLFEISGRDFADFTQSALLSHDFTVPIDVQTTTEKGVPSMRFTRGQTISGQNAVFTLLHHVKYDLAHTADRHLLLTEFLMQTLQKTAITTDPSVYYSRFVSAFKTDMTAQDVETLIEVLYTLPLYIGADESATTVRVIEVYKCGAFLADGSFRIDTAALRTAAAF